MDSSTHLPFMIRSSSGGRIVRSDRIVEIAVRDITTKLTHDQVGVFGVVIGAPDLVLWTSGLVPLVDGHRTSESMEELVTWREFAHGIAAMVSADLITGADEPVTAYGMDSVPA